MRFVGSCSRKIASHLARATRTPSPDRVPLFARERENVGQEGFNALVHRGFACDAACWPALGLAPSSYTGQAFGRGDVKPALQSRRKALAGRSGSLVRFRSKGVAVASIDV